MKTLMLLLLLVPSVCFADGFHLSVGLGIHDPAYDWHQRTQTVQVENEMHTFTFADAYQTNPLGIVRASYQVNRWQFGIEHVSSIPNHKDDHGLTMAYVLVDIY